MTDRHPAPDPALLDRFEAVDDPESAKDRWLSGIALVIAAEARATKCEHIRYADALLLLTFERWERNIINAEDRDFLVRRIYA